MLESHEHKHATHEFDGIVENRVSTPPVYFTMLFYGLIIWGVVFIAWFLLSGWSSHDEFAEKMAAHTGTPVAAVPAAAVAPAAAGADGAELFAARCAGCHGSKGEGGFGPDLTGGGHSDELLRDIIAHGRGNMPGFAGQLTADEIEAVSAFVQTL